MKMKRMILLFTCCMFFGVSPALFSLDWTHGPGAVQPGNFLISGGFSLGSDSYSYRNYSSGSVGTLGFTVAVDYALPKYGFTVGGETGYTHGNFSRFDIGVIPFMGRFGYHPDFGVANLDVYALAKIGFVIGHAEEKFAGGFGIGFGFGGRYFFINNFGAFAELGLDGYFFDVAFFDVAHHITGLKIFTIGVTYKLGK